MNTFFSYINDNIIKNDKNLNTNIKHNNENKNLEEEENIFYNDKEVDNLDMKNYWLIYLIHLAMI